jgi:diaminobutyrate-2-oxoglutarate transaminase
MDKLNYLQHVESNARTYANSFRRLFTRGQGTRVYDSNGQEYLDCLSNAGTLALGHNHPEVKESVMQFLASDQLQQALDLATPAKHAFVEQLFSMLPGQMGKTSRIQFCGPSGSDAVEAAIKLTKHYTGRGSIMAFHGAYHGMTAGALAAMGNLGPKLNIGAPGVHFLPFPYTFRCPFGTDGSTTDQLSINYIRTVLSDPESGVPKPAAIILEVVQGEGGCIPASKAWLQELRLLTRKHEVPLIIDEVQTGFGRTGTLFAIEHSGITPDALVLSKAIGGGYPMSVVVYGEELDTWSPGMHAGTFRGNQIAMVAGLATMRIIEREQLAAHAEAMGHLLTAGLKEIAERFPQLGEVRGRGLMIGVEVTRPDTSGSSGSAGAAGMADPTLARSIKLHCFERGLIIETGGRNGSVLRFLPPLIITREDVATILDRFEQAVRAGTRG